MAFGSGTKVLALHSFMQRLVVLLDDSVKEKIFHFHITYHASVQNFDPFIVHTVLHKNNRGLLLQSHLVKIVMITKGHS